MWGPSHEFSDIGVQKLTMNPALQLYTVLLLLPDEIEEEEEDFA